MPNLDFLKNKNVILVGVAVIGVIIVGALVLADVNGESPFVFLSNIFGKSDKQVAEDTIKYINENLSQTPAELVSYSSESGMVKIRLSIGGNEFDSYVSKDGRFLFPEAIDMAPGEGGNTDKDSGADAEGANPPPAEIVKSDSPMLEAYVVARCPFGLQMQRMMADAIKSVPELGKYMKARYIGEISGGKVTAMHGDAEAQENLRQICIREEQPTKYWDYVSCQMKSGDTSGCQTSTGVNSASLNACISNPEKGLAYAKEDFDLSAGYDITGSPTLILGGAQVSEFNYGGRTSDALKSLICAGFNTEPGFCSQKLNTAEAAASFSETYAGSGASTGEADCGV